MSSWFETNAETYSALKNLLHEHYPSLHAFEENKRVYVRGALPLVVDGKEIERFQVELEFPDDYPNSHPIVRETEGKLEKIDSRHFNPDRTACLFLKDESYKYYSSTSTIVDFINACVKPFFMWQVEYDLTKGKPVRKGRDHGVLGTIEFYKEELQLNSLDHVMKFLEYHTSKKLKGHWSCYCGSGKELRRCHIGRVKDLQGKVTRRHALESLSSIGYHRALSDSTKS